jgi:hypothetical protein
MTTQPTHRGWVPGVDTFGARLALVRQAMGWGNVAEAAVACGVPVASWRNWERDDRSPRDLARIVHKIATRTGCDPIWLAGLDQPGGPTVAEGMPPTGPTGPASPEQPAPRRGPVEAPAFAPAAHAPNRIIRRASKGDSPHGPAGMHVEPNNDTYPAYGDVPIGTSRPDSLAA